MKYFFLVTRFSYLVYVSVLSSFGIVGLLFLMSYGYEDSFLILNKIHFPFADVAFDHLTNLGDSLIISTLVGLVLWKTRPSLVVAAILALIISGFIVQVLKLQLFDHWQRPPTYFLHSTHSIHVIPGHSLANNSFPSGHSSAVSSVITIVVCAFPRKSLIQFLLGIFCIIVAYSRIYVGAHFLGDVLAGMSIGTCSAIVIKHFLLFSLDRFFNQLNPARLKMFSFVFYVLAIVLFLIGLDNLYTHWIIHK